MPFLLLLVIFLGISAHSSAQAEPSSSDPITSSRCNIFTFDSTGSYDPDDEKITVDWDFGDGSGSRLPVVDHTYQVPGDYPVTLTIADNSSKDCCTDIMRQTVRVQIPPDASFSAPENACVNKSVTLQNTSEKVEGVFSYLYDWDFGDGTRSAGVGSAEKTYTKGGDYKITLSVDDQQNSSCSVRSFSRNIHVNEPPMADAGEEIIQKCLASPEEKTHLTFNAGKSSDGNGDSMKYLWDFGSGIQQEGLQATHVFDQPGNYEVKLIVDDGTGYGCSSSVDFVQVRIGVAPKAEAGESVAACSGETISFDGSASYAHTKGTLSARWDFGDGQSAEGLKVDHAYQSAGRYTATLAVNSLVNDACPKSQDTRSVLINTPPQVTLSNPKSACVGQALEFSSVAQDNDSNALEYYWTFGDGEILRAGPKVAHEYKQGGNYKVSVIVDDGQKTSCSTATVESSIKVNTPPSAKIMTSQPSQVGKPIEFDASGSMDSDGDTLVYQWDFGDGTRGEGVKTSHIYEQRGSYEVKLTVEDASGTSCDQAHASVVLDVRSAPVAVMNIR